MPDSVALCAYIDETGDRGLTSKDRASPVFGMAAVLVDNAGASRLRSALQQLRADFKVPAKDTMSWKRHVKSHDRRKHAARVLAAVPGVTVLYAYYRKDALTHGTYHEDRQRSYDFLALKMYKAVLFATAYGAGQATRTVSTRFGHVKGHDHRATLAYLTDQGTRMREKLPSHAERDLKFVAADTHPESQAADLYAGFLKAAIWEDEFGDVEGGYLLDVWHQIRQAELCNVPTSRYCAVPLGIFSMPHTGLLKAASWFPCGHCVR